MRKLLLATSAIVPIGLTAALANPQGGQVVGGSATIAGTGTSNVTITQTTQSAVVNWNSFNIGKGETTRFIQPNSSSSILNRVTGDPNPSQILGTLSANGRVFVINPNGVLIGNGAVINTAGFLATTHDIANADFMAGRYNFNIPGNPSASVVNLGTITATNSGFAALVAPGVRNAGVITATFGKVALASANSFSLDLYGDKLITIGVSDSIASSVKDVATGQTLKSLVQNEGKLQANGGLVQLTAAAARTVVDSVINTSGVIEARSIGRREGRIVLGGPTAGTKFAGAGTQTVKVSGKLDVSNKTGKGGKIEITGENIVLAAATLDASGKTGGGKVLIGGDVAGGAGNAAVAHLSQAQLEGYPILTATTVSVDAASSINASATESGNGGKVVVWADGATVFNGGIAARGGSLSGNGGFAEVSGKQSLTFAGAVDLGAPKGVAGTLLLDPLNARIDDTAGPGVITASSIQHALQFGNVMVTTNNSIGDEAGDLTVAAPITWANDNSLWLAAYRNIYVNANITNNSPTVGSSDNKHQINLISDYTGTGVGSVYFGSGAIIKSKGEVNIAFNPTGPGPKYSNPNEDYSGNVDVSGGGTFTQYMKVNTAGDLQAMNNNLWADYVLGRDINMAGVNDFVPIGGYYGFSGTLEGLGHTISNLTIEANTWANLGLFTKLGWGSEVSHLTLENFNIKDGGIYGANVGTLAGWNFGKIQDVMVTGSLVTAEVPFSNAGGLVGKNSGYIDYVSVIGTNVVLDLQFAGSLTNAGGIAGVNTGTIRRSFSALDISLSGGVFSVGDGDNYVSLGGLVGVNYGWIKQAWAAVPVKDVNEMAAVGGLVGHNKGYGKLREVYSLATSGPTDPAGLVGASGSTGALIGLNDNSSSYAIKYAYWLSTSGLDGVGGSGVPLGSTNVEAMSYADLTNGTLPVGFNSNDWFALSTIPPQLKPSGSSSVDGVVLTADQSGQSPAIPNSVQTPPVIIFTQPPDNTTPLPVFISLNNGPGPNINNLVNPPVPGIPGFTPPPLPPRSVPGPDGETFSSIPPLNETRFFTNQVILQVKLDLPQSELNRLLTEMGLTVLDTQTIDSTGRLALSLQITNGMSVRDVIRSLESRSIVSIAQPNYQFRLMQPAAGAVPGKGDPAQYVLNKLKIEGLPTGKGVTVAVIDSEVDKRHTELQGSIRSELDTLGVKEPPHSHGTAMVGAIASRDRLRGVAPDARILAIRAFGEANQSAEGTTYNIIKGIEWAIDQGAKVVNMSFAGPRDPSIERALKAAYDKGIVLVAAAGNAGPKSPPLYPAADPSVIAVTATDMRDGGFRGANRGPQLSVAAPGVDILAPAPDETYQMSTGTSIATAHVSGVVALMLERDPTLKPADVRRILEASATDLGPKGKDAQYGWGLVNPRKALELVEARKKSAGAAAPAR